MNFGQFLYIQPYNNKKKQVRNIENVEKKLANARVAIVFNKTCLNICIYIYTIGRTNNYTSRPITN